MEALAGLYPSVGALDGQNSSRLPQVAMRKERMTLDKRRYVEIRIGVKLELPSPSAETLACKVEANNNGRCW